MPRTPVIALGALASLCMLWFGIRSLLALGLLTPSLPASFSGSALAQNGGPDLIFLDSLVLEETDEHYIGNPLALFVAPDGALLVSDGFADTVLRYDATGRLVGRLGRSGGGPGEFRNLGGVGFVAADIAGFLDEAGELKLFALTTDAHPGSVRLDLDNRPSAFAVRGDSLWFAGINPVFPATHGAIAIGDLLSAASAGDQSVPIMLDRGTPPAPYAESHALARTLSHAFLAVGDGGVVLGFTASPFLLRTDHLGDVVDTVWIAQGNRRGEPDEDEFFELMRRDQPQSLEEMRSWMFQLFGSVSFVRGLSLDKVGNVYTLHQDSDRDAAGTMTGLKLYATVSRFDGSRGCPGDTLIPTSDVGAPIPLLQGRTLWILDRQFEGGGTSGISTIVRRFTIDPERCTGTVR